MNTVAAVGDKLLSSFLQVLFDKLDPEHVEDFIRERGIEEEVLSLKKTLADVDRVIHNAEIVQYKDEQVKSWLKDLKEAAYDAENVIDDFATEALRIKLEAEWSDEVKDAACDVDDLTDEVSMTREAETSLYQSEIKAITKTFDELSQKIIELGLEGVGAGSSSSCASNETSSLVDINQVYGRDGDVKQIINLLLTDKPSAADNKISIIPIVGMGGVGKTTLAQIVYNDVRVKDDFSFRAWFCVSAASSLESITNIIYESITSNTSTMMDIYQIQNELKKKLIREKFLIVLDDVCIEKVGDWDLLWRPFGVGAAGSTIIVTARNRIIASNMGRVVNYNLQPFSENDYWNYSWSVFVQHAFKKRSVVARLYLVTIGKEIVRKCKGLPLALKLLGGILHTKRQYEWENILNSKIWELKEEDGIPTVFKLCYYFLPSHLSNCFAYCSIFSKGYEFAEKQVVLLWMAEGFLQPPEEEMDLEDFGHKCFGELLSMSFFQPSSRKKGWFVMHDNIRDLADWVAGEFCFRLEDLLGRGMQCGISEKARHLSYISGGYDGVQKFKALDGVHCLRTFLPLNMQGIAHRYLTTDVTFNLLPKLKFLRVLSLCGYCIIKLPSSVGDLEHLRYLDLSQTKIKSLPESVSTLYNLQTLLLKNCSSLNKLPEEMKNLVCLRHLDISENTQMQAMPPRVGRLTSLRELSDFVVGKDNGAGIGELINLIHLQGTLRISKLENVFDALQAREANLCDKNGLQVLELEWSLECDYPRKQKVEQVVLDMLRPHEKLKELTIKGYNGISFPTWIGDPSFSNMTLLKLEGCRRCTALPPLGQLSMLKDLSIGGMNEVATVGPDFYGPSLERLLFQDMKGWAYWFVGEINEQDGLFSHLRELSIVECPKLLGSFPNHLPSLEKLVVRGCERLTVTLSRLPRLCKLEIRECQEVMQRNTVDLSSLKSVALKNNAKVTLLAEGLIDWWTGMEYLEISGCDELVFLWQNEASILKNLTSLHCLEIKQCPQFVSFMAKKEDEEELWDYLKGEMKKGQGRSYASNFESSALKEEMEKEQGQSYAGNFESWELKMFVKLENREDFHKLSSLRELSIEGCPQIVSFPVSGLPPTLRKLRIIKCNALESIGEVIWWHNNRNSSLEYLLIDGCDSLTTIGSEFLYYTVKELIVKGCPILKVLINDKSFSLNSGRSLIESLSIENCSSLESLCRWIVLPNTLKSLFIWRCPELESLGKWFTYRIDIISIEYCGSLKSLPSCLFDSTGVHISNCPSLVRLRYITSNFNILRKLEIENCEKLQALPDYIHSLKYLQELLIINCPSIVSLPKGGFPTNIAKLEIGGSNICKLLFGWGLHRFNCLRELSICSGGLDLVSFPEEEELEMRMVLPSSLILLSISNFPNLERLSSKGFRNLTSLERLRIEHCPKLQSFPEKGLFPSLLRLDILSCPMLEQQLRKRSDQGQEWLKISHIPCVTIDGMLIYDDEEE